MTRTIGPLVVIALVSGAAIGQLSDATPKFELADVHPSAHATGTGLTRNFMRTGFYHGGRYEVRNASMVDLVRTAYGVDPDKVLGGPSWLEMNRYDVNAKAPANATAAQLKLMLRDLLAERFKLVVHNDKKDLPTYAVRAGKKPLLKESDGTGDAGCHPAPAASGQNGGGMLNMNGVQFTLGPDFMISWLCQNITMAAFAEALHNMPADGIGNNPLVDETGIKGAFDFNLKYALIVRPDSGGVGIIDAVDKQLGLKLEPTKAPLPVIVVDSVEEKPTANAPDIAQRLPPIPTEFEVADVKPTAPVSGGGVGIGGAVLVGRGGRGGFVRGGAMPGGRVEYHGAAVKNLIGLAFDVSTDRIVGAPKSAETDLYEIVAKAPAAATSGMAAGTEMGGSQVDDESLQLMMQALLNDRFKLAVHTEERPLDTYVLVSARPKLKKADPAGRTNCVEGPGPDGKDPRVATPALGRLVTCLNMTMAQLAEQLPSFASGYFRTVPTVVNETGLDGAFDMTLSFSGAGFQNNGGGGRGGRGGDAAPAPVADGSAQASDPGQGVSLLDALEKQFGLKLEVQKRPASVLVIDHVEQKPTDN